MLLILVRNLHTGVIYCVVVFINQFGNRNKFITLIFQLTEHQRKCFCSMLCPIVKQYYRAVFNSAYNSVFDFVGSKSFPVQTVPAGNTFKYGFYPKYKKYAALHILRQGQPPHLLLSENESLDNMK